MVRPRAVERPPPFYLVPQIPLYLLLTSGHPVGTCFLCVGVFLWFGVSSSRAFVHLSCDTLSLRQSQCCCRFLFSPHSAWEVFWHSYVMQPGFLAAHGRQSFFTSSPKIRVQLGTTCFTRSPRLRIFASSSLIRRSQFFRWFLHATGMCFRPAKANRTGKSSTENIWTPLVGMDPTFFHILGISVAMQLLAFSSPPGCRGSATAWSLASPGGNDFWVTGVA